MFPRVVVTDMVVVEVVEVDVENKDRGQLEKYCCDHYQILPLLLLFPPRATLLLSPVAIG
jgi:hypothetical protein